MPVVRDKPLLDFNSLYSVLMSISPSQRQHFLVFFSFVAEIDFLLLGSSSLLLLFPAVASLPLREATTGNASAVRRLGTSQGKNCRK